MLSSYEHEQRVVLLFLLFKIIRVMEKNQEKTKMDTILAERMAAHQLMTQWVRDNAEDVAHAISELAPFICGQCTVSGMKELLNTVNITFASVALEVIRSRNENGGDDTKCLPVDALEMQNTLYELSRFLKMFKPLGYLMEKNENMPAFRMSITAYDKVDSV